jgi:hypothetical protein
MPQPGLVNPDQAAAEHSQDAAAGLGTARMVACLAWRYGRKHDRGAAANSGALAGARRCALSVTPLLEPLDLRPWLGRGVDWTVGGGETGARDARYMEPDWARDLRDQCRDTGAALFLKQMWKRQAIPADLMVREYPAL